MKASSKQFSSSTAASYELAFILPNGATLFYPKSGIDRFLRNALTYLPNYKCHFPEDHRRNLTNNMGGRIEAKSTVGIRIPGQGVKLGRTEKLFATRT